MEQTTPTTTDKTLNGKKRRRKLRQQLCRKSSRKGVKRGWVRYHIKKQKGACYWCGIIVWEKMTLDHYVPISKGGLDVFNNTVGSCDKCNSEKSNMLPDEWEIIIKTRRKQT
jgi:5-methylcytosine-specific restriction endonuclease McrA